MMESPFSNGVTMGVLGFLLGALFFLVISRFGNTHLRTALIEKEKCEQNIPRNQQCKITAIPE